MIPIFDIIIALAPPVIVIMREKKEPVKSAFLYTALSIFATGFAIINEIITIKQRLLAGDIGGIEDTIGAAIIISIAILAAATVLNAVALAIHYEK